ncbi:hypothetical protein BDR07DRAFT_398185 [Suillus spraguei]|nr:hypothetical protein BDR07DRAFT_398185 [Suillus spraguei]
MGMARWSGNKTNDFPPTSRKAPWVVKVNWDSCHNVAEMLHREVEAFVRYMSPTEVEEEIRGLIINLVLNAITNAFPMLPFGSYETELCILNGDIDLVIKSDSMAYSDKVNVLRTLANVIKRTWIGSKVTLIAKAKVPIIKLICGNLMTPSAILPYNSPSSRNDRVTGVRLLPACLSLSRTVRLQRSYHGSMRNKFSEVTSIQYQQHKLTHKGMIIVTLVVAFTRDPCRSRDRDTTTVI